MRNMNTSEELYTTSHRENRNLVKYRGCATINRECIHLNDISPEQRVRNLKSQKGWKVTNRSISFPRMARLWWPNQALGVGDSDGFLMSLLQAP